MHNAIGSVTPTNISRETDYFHVVMQYLKQKPSSFLSPGYALSMLFNFGHSSASASYKRESCKKMCTALGMKD